MAIGVFNGNFRAGDYRRYRQQVEADARDPKQALLRIEKKLMQECKDLEGDSFVTWYESDAVPDNGFIQERIDMIRARIADLQAQPSPIDEAQAVELEIGAKLDSAPMRNWDADWEIHCQEVNDTRATDYPM
jgi:hypothetical protein